MIRDYNFISRHHPIGPLVIDLNTHPKAFNLFIKYLAVKIDNRNVQGALADLKQAWTATLPDRPFDAFFLEDRLNDSCKTEQKLSRITIIFFVLAIVVACLGLFGLATFSVERRTKEIGMRKVPGIRTFAIMILLSNEFFYLILISFAVSIPVTCFLLEQWLNEFACRISIDPWPFLIAALITLSVSAATVFYHALKASWLNPVHALRHE